MFPKFNIMVIRYLLATLGIALVGLAAFWVEIRINIETRINNIFIRELQYQHKEMREDLQRTKSELSSVINSAKVLKENFKIKQVDQNKRHEDMLKLIQKGVLWNEEARKRGKIPKSNESVGFTSRLLFETFKNGDVMIFKNVLTNYAGGYDSITGQFTCTVPGLYFFHLSILSLTDNALAHIVKNDEYLVYAFTASKSNNQWQAGSATVVIGLNIGDKVWVKSGSSASFDHQSHLSGLLIAR